MELLSPTSLCVHPPAFEHEGGAELVDLLGSRHFAVHHFSEDGIQLRLGKVVCIKLVDTMVGKATTHRGEKVVTLLQDLN